MIMNLLRSILVLLMVVTLNGCAAQRTDESTNEVRTLGANANLGKGDFGSYADLRDLRGLRHLYALGPVQHLGGEVLIIDSVPYGVEVRDQQLQVTSSWDFQPPFLVFSQIRHWKSIAIPDGIRSYSELEAWLGPAAQRQGLRDGQPFAFQLKATVAALTVTVMNRPASAVAGDRPTRSYQTTWDIGRGVADFIGFYSTQHAGVFLGADERMHIHAITRDRRKAGHVQAFQLLPGGTLYLPQ
jgi:acetolactate decarboxylase